MSVCDILPMLERYNKIIAWGAGKYFEYYYSLLGDKITYIVDKNINLHGKKKKGMIINPITELELERDKEKCLIVVFNAVFEDIFSEVKKVGKFDIIDVKTIELLYNLNIALEHNVYNVVDKSHIVLVCAGIHALWDTNGARKFIDAQNNIVNKKVFKTVEIAPVPHYYRECSYYNPFMLVSIDKKNAGIFTITDLINTYPIVNSIIIHSLYYNHEVLEILLQKITVKTNILYYLHDYYCICDNRFLYYQRNACLDNNNCLQCMGCANQNKQKKIFEFHQKLFDRYAIKLIAPSYDAAKRVGQVFKNAEVEVISHLTYTVAEYDKKPKRAIRVAYIGGTSWTKGWEEYKHIYKSHKGKYEFYCLGTQSSCNYIEGIVYIDVTILKMSNALSMVEALKRCEIDIVYLGAVWPETFSYTYYEAYEAGCFVITNKLSGNIYDQVKKNQNGIILEAVNDVIEWLGDVNKVSEAVWQMNKKIVDVKPDETFLKYLS